MEEAKKASLWAQQLSLHCGHLCSQSKEGTQKMRTDVKQAIETKIKDEEFWIRELETRTSNNVKVTEELEASKRRHDRAVTICERLIAVNHECSRQRKAAFQNADVVTELLTDEANILRQVLNEIVASIAKATERTNAMNHVRSALEHNIYTKRTALDTDQQSLTLKHQQWQLPITNNSRESVAITKASSASSRQYLKMMPNDDRILQVADDELHLSELLLDEVNEMFCTTTEIISTVASKVTTAIQEHVANLQHKKNDLERHLDMTNVHMEVTEKTMSQLDKAIEEKETDIELTKRRMSLYDAQQQQTPSNQYADNVRHVLERELIIAENEKEQLINQFPALEATLRSLRRARLEISQKISKKIERIETEEVKCLGIRMELTFISL